MAIPTADLIRLIDHTLGNSLRLEPTTFRFWMKEGINIIPDFDDRDVATLARIAAGERYEVGQ
jgi:hypothetical protein